MGLTQHNTREGAQRPSLRGLGAVPPEDATSDSASAFREQTSPERVEVIEALTHQTYQTKRLFRLGTTWEDVETDTKPTSSMVDLYRSGQSLAKVAAKYGISPHAASDHLKAAGVVLRGRHDRV